MDQRVPFQDSMKGSNWDWPASPTAAQKVGETHDTPARRSNVSPGDGTTAQRVPFQDSIKGRWLLSEPTAVHADAEVQDTPTSSPFGSAGVSMLDQRVPFNRSARGPTPNPTATQAVAETQDTASNCPLKSGALVIVHRLPFHDSMSGDVAFFAVRAPTAAQKAADAQDTAARKLSSPLMLGLGTMAHDSVWALTGTSAPSNTSPAKRTITTLAAARPITHHPVVGSSGVILPMGPGRPRTGGVTAGDGRRPGRPG